MFENAFGARQQADDLESEENAEPKSEPKAGPIEEPIPSVEETMVKESVSTTDQTNSSAVFVAPKETLTYIHMQSYPIAASWIKILHWLPAPHFARDMMFGIAYSSYLRGYTLAIDSSIDKGLDQLDKRAPFVKTLRMRDIRNVLIDNPIHSIVSTTQQALHDTTDLAKTHVIKPSRTALYTIRDIRDGYIDFQSQPIIRSQMNSVLKQVNVRLIERVNTYLPPDETKNELPISYVTFDPKSNELSYTVRIINLAIIRFRPVLRERLRLFGDLPANSRRHIGAIYQSSKENRGDGRIIVLIASLETIRILMDEGYELLTDNSFVNFLKSEPKSNEHVTIAEEDTIPN